MASRAALLRALLACAALLAVAGALSAAAATDGDASGATGDAAAPASSPSTLARVLQVTQGQLTSGLGTMFSVVRGRRSRRRDAGTHGSHVHTLACPHAAAACAYASASCRLAPRTLAAAASQRIGPNLRCRHRRTQCFLS
jgi:hypothetical protein